MLLLWSCFASAQCRDRSSEMGLHHAQIGEYQSKLIRKAIVLIGAFERAITFNHDADPSTISYEDLNYFESFFYPNARIVNFRDPEFHYVDYRDYASLIHAYFKDTNLSQEKLNISYTPPVITDIFEDEKGKSFHFCLKFDYNIIFVLNEQKEVMMIPQATNKINKSVELRADIVVNSKTEKALITGIELVKMYEKK
jgi:hypothetical protein